MGFSLLQNLKTAIFQDSIHEVLPLHDLSKSLLSHVVSDSIMTAATNNISRQIRNRGKEGKSPQTAITEGGIKSLLYMAVLPFKTSLL